MKGNTCVLETDLNTKTSVSIAGTLSELEFELGTPRA
jgi:hypothetical protein